MSSLLSCFRSREPVEILQLRNVTLNTGTMTDPFEGRREFRTPSVCEKALGSLRSKAFWPWLSYSACSTRSHRNLAFNSSRQVQSSEGPALSLLINSNVPVGNR